MSQSERQSPGSQALRTREWTRAQGGVSPHAATALWATLPPTKGAVTPAGVRGRGSQNGLRPAARTTTPAAPPPLRPSAGDQGLKGVEHAGTLPRTGARPIAHGSVLSSSVFA